mgnify:CR=1 FL=1
MYTDFYLTDYLFVFGGTTLVSYFMQINVFLVAIVFSGLIAINKLLGNPLHQYRDLLEKPNQSVHAYTFCHIPYIDLLITLMGASVVSYYRETDLLMTFVGSIFLGQFLHYLFGVNTRFFNSIGIKFKED